MAFTPAVGCIPSTWIMPEAPPAAASLQAKVKALSSCDELKTFSQTLEKAVTRLEGVNLDSVAAPVKKYADVQKEQVDSLLGVIEPIKQASEGADAASKMIADARKSIGGW